MTETIFINLVNVYIENSAILHCLVLDYLSPNETLGAEIVTV